MERTERLVDLIALLLHARRPVSFEQLRDAFPDDYALPGATAARRKFERDKADLLELGIPLRYLGPEEDDDAEGGYLIERDRFYLPELALEPEEMAVMYLAGMSLHEQRSFPYRDALEMALRKMQLGAGVPEAAPASGRVTIDHAERQPGPELEHRVATLRAAVLGRRRVRFVYHARYNDAVSQRRVDPYGLFCRRGRWSLVGHAHERGAIRVFLLHRMRELELESGASGPPEFEVPASFRLGDWARLPAWRYQLSEPVTVELEAHPDSAWVAEEEFGERATATAGGWKRLSVETTHVDAVLEWALRRGEKARIVGPPEVRERIRRTLEATLKRATGGSA